MLAGVVLSGASQRQWAEVCFPYCPNEMFVESNWTSEMKISDNIFGYMSVHI